ncbi:MULTISPECIES: Tim44 domain-containing protein [unclassified Aureimonas]|uniref:Tim44 domain-containing protein n=1 Tax=unclassified Aureimonas TaxID=2615206 RepID=UPI00070134F5|nr:MULTISPECIES: Tim44 domain-containing protein [unclassified Aureimonas]KQT52850.1 hypothetical protein ASG62_13080 [Aureimonas sp. Leaf427]KQT80309.1 hypothetical protein ASG54_06930 [Aureimonas sp. Leaf460]
MLSSRTFRFASLFAGLVMAFSMVAIDHADARRGGSFGSRGSRTFQSAPATTTAPRPAAPVERSMTPATAAPSTAAAGRNAAGAQRPGFMNGFGGSLLRGLAIGGLFGLLMGSGFGGMAGMFGLLFQILLIGGGIWLVMRLLRSRKASQPAMAGMGGMNRSAYDQNGPRAPQGGGLSGLGSSLGGMGAGLGARNAKAKPSNPDELAVSSQDLDTFEKMLTEIQSAYGREDYGTLRRVTTPEMMSYLSEELGSNASRGLRNDVSDVRLLQGDIAESWRDANRDYATVAMRYSSIDATVERESGRVVEGSTTEATESTEVWTFMRENRGAWQLSAIQEA